MPPAVPRHRDPVPGPGRLGRHGGGAERGGAVRAAGEQRGRGAAAALPGGDAGGPAAVSARRGPGSGGGPGSGECPVGAWGPRQRWVPGNPGPAPRPRAEPQNASGCGCGRALQTPVSRERQRLVHSTTQPDTLLETPPWFVGCYCSCLLSLFPVFSYFT